MPGSDCAYTSIRGRRVNVMLDANRIVRFETASGKPSPVNGLGAIKVGDAAFEIETVFGRSASHTRHKYVDGGWYYVLIDYDGGLPGVRSASRPMPRASLRSSRDSGRQADETRRRLRLTAPSSRARR